MPDNERSRYGVTVEQGKTHGAGGVMKDFENGYGKYHTTPENEKVMAALIQHPVKQFTTPARYPF